MPAPRLHRWLQLLAPSTLRSEGRRVLAKAARRARRVDRRVARLEPVGPFRGEVLFSFIIDPFLLPAGAEPSLDHTHDWESREMARAWAELGFGVTAIHWTNTSYVPERPVDVLVDVRLQLERLAPTLPGALAIFHAETAHWSFHNRAQRERLDDLARRRGLTLPPNKMIEESDAVRHADAGTILGNEFTASTYAFAGVPLWRVPISNPLLYDFPGKDWEACRRSFVWFGSGGLVHKGLDRVLEAFAAMPDFRLTVCGPIRRERDFALAFHRELYRTPNITTLDWVDVAGERFRDIARTHLGLVYPTCSEGGGASVITCMHAGLLPLVTWEASVDLDEGNGLILADPSVEGIRGAVAEAAALPAERLAALTYGAWSRARRDHTRETFAAGYRAAIEEILDRFRPGWREKGLR